MSEIPTLPNGETLMLEKVLRLANLIEARVEGMPDAPPGVVFLPSSQWAQLMLDIRSKVTGSASDEFFNQQQFLIGRVTFRNAGTDDPETVMLANRMYEEQSGFRFKREHLRTA